MEETLDRYIQAQECCYATALSELRAGEKKSHWIWYIFPQIKGLGHSYNSQFYGLSGVEEAEQYLKLILGMRIRERCKEYLK